MKVSKSKLKAKMLSVFRQIERTGEEVILTDHGRPALRKTRLPQRESVDGVFGKHRHAVIYGVDIMKPTNEEWPET